MAKDSLAEQTEELAAVLPERPLVLGGCCCAHVGAVRGLAGRVDRLAVVWIDAHGDLNTPQTSPSGNLWGMPLRMLLDDGVVTPEDVALVGARSLDPPEQAYLDETGIDASLDRALEGSLPFTSRSISTCSTRPRSRYSFPEPDGASADEIDVVLRDVVSRAPLAGVGVTGHVRDDAKHSGRLTSLDGGRAVTGPGPDRT